MPSYVSSSVAGIRCLLVVGWWRWRCPIRLAMPSSASPSPPISSTAGHRGRNYTSAPVASGRRRARTAQSNQTPALLVRVHISMREPNVLLILNLMMVHSGGRRLRVSPWM